MTAEEISKKVQEAQESLIAVRASIKAHVTTTDLYKERLKEVFHDSDD